MAMLDPRAALVLFCACSAEPAPDPWIRVDPDRPASSQERADACSRWTHSGGCTPSQVPVEDVLDRCVERCAEGAPDACLRAGRTLAGPIADGDLALRSTVLPALEHLCAEGSLEACFLRGAVVEDRARQELACRDGWAEACVALHDPRDPDSRRWLVHGCALGDTRWCQAALLYLRDTRQHLQRAILACGLAEGGDTGAGKIRDAMVADGLVPADVCSR